MSYIRKPLRISPDANVADFRSLTEFLRAENWARQYFDDVEKERSAVDLAWEEHVLFMGQEEHDGDVRQDNSWAMPSSTPEAPEEKEARQQDEKPCVESSVHVSNTVTTEEDGPRSVVLQHSEIELCQQSQTMLPLDEARAEMMRGIEDHHFTLAQMSDLGPMFQELERTPPRGREKTARSKKRQRSQVGTSPEPDRSAKRPRHDAYSAVHLLHNSTNVHQVQNDSDSLTLMLNDVASVPQHDDSILTTTPYPSKSSSLTPPCPDQYLNDYPDISLPSSTPPIPVLKRRNRLASRRGRRDFIIHEDKTAQPARDERWEETEYGYYESNGELSEVLRMGQAWDPWTVQNWGGDDRQEDRGPQIRWERTVGVQAGQEDDADRNTGVAADHVGIREQQSRALLSPLPGLRASEEGEGNPSPTAAMEKRNRSIRMR